MKVYEKSANVEPTIYSIIRKGTKENKTNKQKMSNIDLKLFLVYMLIQDNSSCSSLLEYKDDQRELKKSWCRQALSVIMGIVFHDVVIRVWFKTDCWKSGFRCGRVSFWFIHLKKNMKKLMEIWETTEVE